MPSLFILLACKSNVRPQKLQVTNHRVGHDSWIHHTRIFSTLIHMHIGKKVKLSLFCSHTQGFSGLFSICTTTKWTSDSQNMADYPATSLKRTDIFIGQIPLYHLVGSTCLSIPDEGEVGHNKNQVSGGLLTSWCPFYHLEFSLLQLRSSWFVLARVHSAFSVAVMTFLQDSLL